MAQTLEIQVVLYTRAPIYIRITVNLFWIIIAWKATNGCVRCHVSPYGYRQFWCDLIKSDHRFNCSFLKRLLSTGENTRWPKFLPFEINLFLLHDEKLRLEFLKKFLQIGNGCFWLNFQEREFHCTCMILLKLNDEKEEKGSNNSGRKMCNNLERGKNGITDLRVGNNWKKGEKNCI